MKSAWNAKEFLMNRFEIQRAKATRIGAIVGPEMLSVFLCDPRTGRSLLREKPGERSAPSPSPGKSSVSVASE